MEDREERIKIRRGEGLTAKIARDDVRSTKRNKVRSTDF